MVVPPVMRWCVLALLMIIARPNEASAFHILSSDPGSGAGQGGHRHRRGSRGVDTELAARARPYVELVQTNEQRVFGRSGTQEASVSHLMSGIRLQSKAEMMSSMTLEKAYRVFLAMNRSRAPDFDSLAGLVQAKLQGLQQNGGGRRLRTAVRSNENDELSNLYAARDMINAMMDESITNKELEIEKCENYNRTQLRVIWENQHDIDYASAQAAEARGASLRATEISSDIQEVKLPNLKNQLHENTDRCQKERSSLTSQLDLVAADEGVLRNIFSLIQCEDVDMKSLMPEPLMMLELQSKSNSTMAMAKYAGGASRAEDGALVRCPACGGGSRPSVHLRHARVQQELQKLRSVVAKQYVDGHLQEAFAESARLHPSKIRGAVLVQAGSSGGGAAAARGATELLPGVGCSEDLGPGGNGSSYRGCVTTTAKGFVCQSWTANHSGATNGSDPENVNTWGVGDHNYCRNPTPLEKETIWCYTADPNQEWGYCQPLEELQAPEGAAQSSCAISEGCKIGPGDCGKMRDRFLIILAGVKDKEDQLNEDKSVLEQECAQTHSDLMESIRTLGMELREQETELAMATKQIQDATSAESHANRARLQYVKEYHRELKECCDNVNGLLREACSLEKLRAELLRAEGGEVKITDCEVSEWTDGECSKDCEGGTQERTRSILAHRENGTHCPPMVQKQDCNLQHCPVDCEVGVWSEWTACTAGCGGGVRSRIRQKKVPPKYDGEDCPETEQTVPCNVGRCNSDCVLGEWGAWTACSKACDTGHRERRRGVEVDARGDGTCPQADSEARLIFEECNTDVCMKMIEEDHRTVLQCNSKLDLVILMDGSGSLEEYGFQQAKDMSARLLRSLQGSAGLVQVAFLTFGGPTTLDAFERCTGSSKSNDTVDAQRDCGMHWVSHFTSDTQAVAARVMDLPFPMSTTMTSMALAEAKTEIAEGRTDAPSVTLVITDAKPLSARKTATAAEEMKRNARLIWVPIGPLADETVGSMKAWASKPWQDNVIHLADFDALTAPHSLNLIISSLCPYVA